MSDADDQMGGTGSETGLPPEEVTPGEDNAAPAEPGRSAGTPAEEAGEHADGEADVDDAVEQSFPASDPPGRY